MTICEKCNGRGMVQLSFDSPRLTCSACPPTGPPGRWYVGERLRTGIIATKALGAAMDEIFYKHHEGGNE